jgi:DNA-binding ferritin-like protein
MNRPKIHLTADQTQPDIEFCKEPVMSKPTVEQARMGTEGIAFCIARTLIERDPSLKAPMRANLRKMWELLEEREDHGAADMVDTMIRALNDPAFFKP